MERLMWQSLTGRLFHRRGPVTAKERSPRRMRVHWMTHVLTSDDRSWRRPEAVTSWQSSTRYCGAEPCRVLKTNMASLNSIRWTGSQWSCRRIGVMWSRRRVPVIRRAAAFWIACNRRIRPSVIAVQTWWQTPGPSWQRRPTTNGWLGVADAADGTLTGTQSWRGQTWWVDCQGQHQGHVHSPPL